MRAHEASLTTMAERTDLMGTVTALILGMFILFMVGFASPGALHEAAHDSRHSIAFPCH